MERCIGCDAAAQERLGDRRISAQQYRRLQGHGYQANYLARAVFEGPVVVDFGP